MFAWFWCGENCGVDPRKVEVGNLGIKIHHRGFDTQAQVWIKICDGAKEWINIA